MDGGVNDKLMGMHKLLKIAKTIIKRSHLTLIGSKFLIMHFFLN